MLSDGCLEIVRNTFEKEKGSSSVFLAFHILLNKACPLCLASKDTASHQGIQSRLASQQPNKELYMIAVVRFPKRIMAFLISLNSTVCHSNKDIVTAKMIGKPRKPVLLFCSLVISCRRAGLQANRHSDQAVCS